MLLIAPLQIRAEDGYELWLRYRLGEDEALRAHYLLQLGSLRGEGALPTLAVAGARVAILGRNAEAAGAKAEDLRAGGTDASALTADVLDKGALRRACA